MVTTRTVFIALTCLFLKVSILVAVSPADFGGNRGWAVSLTDADQYASIGDYFQPSAHWPKNEITGTATARSFKI